MRLDWDIFCLTTLKKGNASIYAQWLRFANSLMTEARKPPPAQVLMSLFDGTFARSFHVGLSLTMRAPRSNACRRKLYRACGCACS